MAQEVGRPLSLIHRWSSQWAWVKRAATYDAEQDAICRAAAYAAQVEMARRHVDMARTVQQKLLSRLDALTIEEIRISDVARLLDTSVKIERQAMGLEGSRVAVDVVATPPRASRRHQQAHPLDTGRPGLRRPPDRGPRPGWGSRLGGRPRCEMSQGHDRLMMIAIGGSVRRELLGRLPLLDPPPVVSVG